MSLSSAPSSEAAVQVLREENVPELAAFLHLRIHSTLRVTPAMEAGLSDHVWSLAEIVALLDRESK